MPTAIATLQDEFMALLDGPVDRDGQATACDHGVDLVARLLSVEPHAGPDADYPPIYGGNNSTSPS